MPVIELKPPPAGLAAPTADAAGSLNPRGDAPLRNGCRHVLFSGIPGSAEERS
jgi:hypothetical protein